jgi:hypothetical protein
MPLLRSRMEVRRMRFRFGLRFFLVMAIWTVVFATIVAFRYGFGW